MTNPDSNFTELKRLFDMEVKAVKQNIGIEIEYDPKSYVIARLLNGQSIKSARRISLGTVKIIEERKVEEGDFYPQSLL